MKVSDRIKLKKRRMMRVCLPLLLVLLLFSGAAGKEVDPYELLGSSVSVFMMLPNEGLNTYMASLQFQGALYNDVKQEIERNFKVQPEFVEFFDSNHGHLLALRNPPVGRQAMSRYTSAFFPLEMPFQMSAQRLTAEIGKLEEETTASVEETTYSGIKCFKVVLLPRNERFNYMRESREGVDHEQWTEMSSFWIDRKNRTVLKNENQILARQLSPGGAPAREQRKKVVIFTRFEKTLGKVLPASMTFNTDGMDLFEQTFSYRKEQNYILPDSIVIDIFSHDVLGIKNSLKVRYAGFELGCVIPGGIFNMPGPDTSVSP